MAQLVFPVEISRMPRVDPTSDNTRFRVLIEGYDESFYFTLPWAQSCTFELAIKARYPKNVPYDEYRS